jgi:hypothetical protein
VDIIAAIDRVTGCQYEPCGRPLDDSPSDDFCSGRCQQAWHEDRAVLLDRYTEPYDLPAYVGNLVELHHGDLVPTVPDESYRAGPPTGVLELSFPDVFTSDAFTSSARAATTRAPAPGVSPWDYLRRWMNMMQESQRVAAEFQRDLVDLTNIIGIRHVDPDHPPVLVWDVDEVPPLDTSRFSGATFDLAHIEIDEVPMYHAVTGGMIRDIRQAAAPAPPLPPASVWGHALAARRNRNTGPPPPKRRAPRQLPARRPR